VPQKISPQLAIEAAARRHADQKAQGAARVMQKHWEQCRQAGSIPIFAAPGAARQAAAFDAALKTRRQNVYDEYRQRLQADTASGRGDGRGDGKGKGDSKSKGDGKGDGKGCSGMGNSGSSGSGGQGGRSGGGCSSYNGKSYGNGRAVNVVQAVSVDFWAHTIAPYTVFPAS
jgi:hypothetical protein